MIQLNTIDQPIKTNLSVLFEYFCMNTGQFDNIKPFNLALSDKIENKKFIITGPSATNSFHKSYNNQRENPVSMGVQKSENVNCIDFKHSI